MKHFLTVAKNDEPLENALKNLLLNKFNHYFEEETSREQKRATLVCITRLSMKKLQNYI